MFCRALGNAETQLGCVDRETRPQPLVHMCELLALLARESEAVPMSSAQGTLDVSVSNSCRRTPRALAGGSTPPTGRWNAVRHTPVRGAHSTASGNRLGEHDGCPCPRRPGPDRLLHDRSGLGSRSALTCATAILLATSGP